MGKASFLEELSIATWAIESHPTIPDFTPPPTLRKLVISFCARNTREYPTVIEKYLNQFTQQKEKSSLKDLKICCDRNAGITATDAATICSLKNLQHLAISSPLRSQSEMVHFAKMLVEGCPYLTSLELTHKVPSAYTLILLQRLQHLQYLALRVGSSTDYRDLPDAFGMFSQLKFVRILPAGNSTFARCLKSCRPDIQVSSGRVYQNYF